MNNEDIKIEIEKLDLEPSLVDEIFAKINNNKEEDNTLKSTELEDIKIKMDTETDWKKKAKLAARIISIGLEN